VFTVYRPGCDGISLHSEVGYHGTYRGSDWPAFSATFTDGVSVVANIGHEMLVGEVGGAPPSVPRIAPEKSAGPDTRDWVYAMTPMSEGVLYGGTAPGAYACAGLRLLDMAERRARPKPLDACSGGLVSEVYSLVRHRDELLVGIFRAERSTP
jgi:hypothetical protein